MSALTRRQARRPRHQPQPTARRRAFHLILIGGYLGLGAIAVAVVWWLVRRTSLSVGQ
jgi:ferric-dicitrate binding protein FerR (iron transport regulator)